MNNAYAMAITELEKKQKTEAGIITAGFAVFIVLLMLFLKWSMPAIVPLAQEIGVDVEITLPPDPPEPPQTTQEDGGGGGGNPVQAAGAPTGNASGGQQNPPVTTTGSGTLTGTYNGRTNVWQYNVNWTALSSAATIVELRGPASAGVNGNLVLTLNITVPGVTGTASGNITLTDEQEANLLAGQLYYTVLTATNVTGEIRGQITATEQ